MGKCNTGFTLAEVLITLGIIGVVAAITIPILQKNIEEVQFKTAYKKAYSDASNIWQSMYLNNEVEPCTTLCETNCSDKNFITFKTHLNIIKSCGDSSWTGSVKGCWELTGESINDYLDNPNPNKTTGAGSFGATDNSGRNWIMLAGNWICGQVLVVDTNGFKNPNQIGKDRFVFRAQNRDGSSGKGIASKIVPSADYQSKTAYCNFPPCYGTRWLYK